MLSKILHKHRVAARLVRRRLVAAYTCGAGTIHPLVPHTWKYRTLLELGQRSSNWKMWLGNSGDGVLFFVHGNLAPKEDASETMVAQQGSDCEKGWDDWGDLGGQGSSQLGRSGRLAPLV